MASTAGKAPARRSEARERLLAKATELFYAEGINAFGVDRIVAAGNVTLATFYRHFPSKGDLVVAYLQSVHEAIAKRAEADVEDGRERIAATGPPVRRGRARRPSAAPPRPPRAPSPRHFVMLRDGAVTAGSLDSPTAAQRT